MRSKEHSLRNDHASQCKIVLLLLLLLLLLLDPGLRRLLQELCCVFLIITVERKELGRLDFVIGLSASLIVQFVKRVAVLICDSPRNRDTCS
jgi:hypothetical protein